MENVFLTSLTTPEVRQLFRQELENYFEKHNQPTPENGTNEQPISTKQLCDFLGICEPTAIRWRRKGKIPFLKIGTRILYQKSAVLAALENKKGHNNGK